MFPSDIFMVNSKSQMLKNLHATKEKNLGGQNDSTYIANKDLIANQNLFKMVYNMTHFYDSYINHHPE